MRDGPPPRDEPALARRAAAAGGTPAEVVARYLAAYGVPARRLRKHARETAILARVLADLPARAVLDSPCGWGRLAPAIAGNGRTIVFADRSAERLAILRSLGLLRLGAPLRAEALALPFRDRCFDLVLSAHLNYHFDRREDRLLHLRECLRVARAAALVSYHDAFSPRRAIRLLGSLLRGRPPLRALAARDLRREAAAAGFVLAALIPLSRFSGHRYALFRRAPT